jgi:hypothetical protein
MVKSTSRFDSELLPWDLRRWICWRSTAAAAGRRIEPLEGGGQAPASGRDPASGGWRTVESGERGQGAADRDEP